MTLLSKPLALMALLLFVLVSPALAQTPGSGSSHLLTLSPIDMVIIALYFVVVLAIGFYLKKRTNTGEDFFMAGRKMTAWIAGLSFISANLSSLETMGWSAMAYQYGMLGAHAYFISGALPILFLAVVMMPFYYICRTHSVPGYLKLRYGESSRSMAGITFAVMTLLVSGSSMFAMAKILNLLLGWDMNHSIWISSLTVAVYVTLGGLISAVFNEVVQFFLIWLGTLLVPILGLIQCGGWHKMMALIQENVKTIHPSVPNADFTALWHNLGSFTANPMGIDWFGMIFGQGIAIGFAYWCTDFLQVQRVIVAKDLRAAQNGTIIGAALKMCVPLIVTIPGLLGLAVLLNPDGIADGPGARERPAGDDYQPHVQRRAAAADGQVSRARPAGPGRDGDDRRVHVGHGRQRQRLRHRLDLRRVSPAAGQERQRPALSGHGPLVLDPRRAAVHRHGLFAVSLLEHPRVPAGVDLLLHRAAVRSGDYRDAVEAGDAGGRFLGLLPRDRVLHRRCGGSSTPSPTATGRSQP